jgi:hypothetical protein
MVWAEGLKGRKEKKRIGEQEKELRARRWKGEEKVKIDKLNIYESYEK